MLNKCSNPSCRASFHTLEEGRLFRLEPDPKFRTSQPKPVEYYWLCGRCAPIMTLRLGDYEDVIAVELPAQLQRVPNIVAVTVLEKNEDYFCKRFPANCQSVARRTSEVGLRIVRMSLDPGKLNATHHFIGVPAMSAQLKKTSSDRSVDAKPANGNLQEEIRLHAYELYERGGRQHGRELDDWLQSESEVMAKRKKGAVVA